MSTTLKALMMTAAAIGLAACSDGDSHTSTASAGAGQAGGVSGRYLADVPAMGIKMQIAFAKDGSAMLTFIEGENNHDMDCTYQSGEVRIALSCFGSSGISLTRLSGGDLEGDIDGMIVRFRRL